MVDGGERRAQGAKLFIGRLPRTADENSVREVTEHFGEIEDIVIVKNRETGESKGCAFVKFTQMNHAEMCRNSLHDKAPFDNSGPLQVRFANGEAERLGIPEGVLNGSAGGESKLFVGGLPRQYDEDMTRQLFASYGEITYLKLFKHPDGAFKGAGFVTLASKDQAFAAIESLHHKHTIPPMERPIEVKFADANKDGGKGGKPSMGGPNRMGQGYGHQGPYGGGFQQAPQQSYGGYQMQSSQPQMHHAPPPPPPSNLTMGDWTEYHTPEGRAYYHNARQNITQWEKPVDSGYGQAQAASGHQQNQRYRPY